MVQEERRRWVALGVSQVQVAEAVGRQVLLTVAIGAPGPVSHLHPRKRPIRQHATAHANMIAEAQRQAARAIQVSATRHVRHMEARGRAQVAPTLHAMHNILLTCIAQRKA